MTMRIRLACLFGCGLALAFASEASAAVPTIDDAQLTQHSTTSNTVIKLVPIQQNSMAGNQGIHCSVTTGKKANVTDPAVAPKPAAGVQKIQTYAPELPAAPTAGATGAQLGSETYFQSSGSVTAGIDATQSTMTANKSVYQALGTQVGTAPTIMGAWDQNTAVRIQNGLSWNDAITAVNQWVTALNALNLDRTNAESRAAGVIRTASPAQAYVPPAVNCPAGMEINQNRRSAADPACVAKRYVDTNQNVSAFLATVQDAASQPSQPGQ